METKTTSASNYGVYKQSEFSCYLTIPLKRTSVMDSMKETRFPTYGLGIATLGGLNLDTDTAISELLCSDNLGAQLELEALLGKSAVESLTRKFCAGRMDRMRN
jgi:hypothetical protein